LLFLLLSPQLYSSNADNGSDGWELWAGFIERLLGQSLSSTAVNGVQIATTPIRVDWDQAGSASVCLFADRISENGLEFRPREGSSFYENYQVFADSLKLPARDPQKESEIRDASNSLGREVAKLTMLQQEQDKAWVEFDTKQKATKDRSEWINYRRWLERSPFAGAILEQKTTVSSSEQALAQLADPRITEAIGDILKAHDPSYKTTVVGKDGRSSSCPQYRFLPSLSSFRSNPSGLKWTISGQNTTKRLDSSKREKQWSIGTPFLSVGGKVVSRASSDLQIGNDMTLDVEFEHLGILHIQAGPWFSQRLLTMFKQGPFKEGSPLSGTGLAWGANSKLGWHPSQVVVADHPTFTVALSLVSDYKKVKADFLHGATIGIGPFLFQADDSSVAKVCWDDKKQTLTLKDSSNSPMVLAVINEPQ
jgi:hypothetical protein